LRVYLLEQNATTVCKNGRRKRQEAEMIMTVRTWFRTTDVIRLSCGAGSWTLAALQVLEQIA